MGCSPAYVNGFHISDFAGGDVKTKHGLYGVYAIVTYRTRVEVKKSVRVTLYP